MSTQLGQEFGRLVSLILLLYFTTQALFQWLTVKMIIWCFIYIYSVDTCVYCMQDVVRRFQLWQLLKELSNQKLDGWLIYLGNSSSTAIGDSMMAV